MSLIASASAELHDVAPVGLVERIEHAVLDHPDHDAVQTTSGTTSYREFGRLVAAFADELAARTALGEFVGIEAERGTAALVAMVGALRARRPFVVLDRRDSDATNGQKASLLGVAVVAASHAGQGEPTLTALPAEWRRPTPTSPASQLPNSDPPAYAIYTSGSTGQPKCVLVRLDPLARIIDDHVRRLEVDASARTLQFARLTFDGCLTEILWTLGAGGCLVVLDEDHLVPGPVLEKTLGDFGITHFKSTPFALTATATVGAGRLRHVVNGGGACRPSTVRKWSATAAFHNAYGTTETTVCNVLSRGLTVADSTDGVPLGEVVGDCGYEVVPRPGHGPVAAGVERGELVITGQSVAEGYLTADGLRRFVDERGRRRYETGDLVEVRNGELYFVERLDRQVKVRGFRLDPGEVETVVCRQPGVRDAVVVSAAHEGADAADADALICYYLGEPDSRAIRSGLEDALDPYKIPSVIKALDAFPYTPNGKVDQDALRARGRPAPEDDDEVVASAHDRVLHLVRGLTGVEDADPADNFFDLGGDSGSAVVLVTRLKEWGWVDVGVRDVLRAPDLQALGDKLHERSV